MVTPTPKKLKNGAVGLHYILDGDAHYGDGPRNHYLTMQNCFDGISVYKQFQQCWDNASEQNKTQLRHFIISFSPQELSCENEADIALAHEWATEYFQQTFPDRQAVIATQVDGEKSKGTIIHCHAMVNNCRLRDYKGFTEKERSRGYFRKSATEFFQQKFAENAITYDYGRNHRSYSLYEREFAEKLSTYKHNFDRLKAEKAKDNPNQMLIADCEEKIRKNKYVWKAHLAQNIKACKDSSVSWNDFVDRLPQFGVVLIDEGKHIKYRLDETEYANYTDKPYPDKAVCRGKTLDESYGRDELKLYFATLSSQQIEDIQARNAMLFRQTDSEEFVDEEDSYYEDTNSSESDYEDEDLTLWQDIQEQDILSEDVSIMEETQPFRPMSRGEFAEYLREHPEHPANLTHSPDFDFEAASRERVRAMNASKSTKKEELPPPVDDIYYEEPAKDMMSDFSMEDWMREAVKDYDNIAQYMDDNEDESHVLDLKNKGVGDYGE